MVIALGISLFVVSVIAITLLIKLICLYRSAQEIRNGFEDNLHSGTNTGIYLSCGDKHMRELARSIDDELASLKKQRLQYIEGDKELKNIVTNLAHDLRTPLTAVYGYIQLLKDESDKKRSEEYLQIVEKQVIRLKELMEEFFDYSVLSAKFSTSEIIRTQVSINAVLTESLGSFYAVFSQRNIEPKIELPDKELFLQSNEECLRRIFDNLIGNAFKYSSDDFEVRLTEDYTVVFENNAPMLDEISVGKVFNRFFTVASGNTSTGLGLGIAKDLTEKLGGTISAKYRKGKLQITLKFPQK